MKQPANPDEVGDGFTSSEIQAAIHPSLHKWQPRCEYKEISISKLTPGPGCVAVMGRIVNFYESISTSKAVNASRGSFKIIVKDDTGAFTVRISLPMAIFMQTDHTDLQVRLFYAKVIYPLRIGLLVSIWAPHVSNAQSSSLTPQQASLITSIFPERENSSYFMIQNRSDEGVLCKTPLGYREGKPLVGLITLQNFIDGGYEVAQSKILVCVKSIGGKKRCRQ